MPTSDEYSFDPSLRSSYVSRSNASAGPDPLAGLWARLSHPRAPADPALSHRYFPGDDIALVPVASLRGHSVRNSPRSSSYSRSLLLLPPKILPELLIPKLACLPEHPPVGCFS